jgi:hypothetical protein
VVIYKDYYSIVVKLLIPKRRKISMEDVFLIHHIEMLYFNDVAPKTFIEKLARLLLCRKVIKKFLEKF